MVAESASLQGHRFFDEVVSLSQQAIAALPITREPPAMNYITGTLQPAAEALAAEHRFRDPPGELVARRLAAAGEEEGEAAQAVGLNTIGMLLDRLSILVVKHWNLLNRADDAEKAQGLLATQVAEIVLALARTRPGHSSINNKITRLSFGRDTAGSFGEMYQGLLMTNCLLWEAQEVLYNHDISALPDSELREYISFFSRENLRRNGFIQGVDQAFWSTGRLEEPAAA